MPNADQKNTVRIIAGKWKGRKIEFADAQGLRPSKDFVRETLFNWLLDDIQNSYCLDLFAGSGALGFEALSRGAKQVVSVEYDARVAQCIQNQITKLQALSFLLMQQSAESFIKSYDGPAFDIIYMDPPFDLVLDGAFFEMLAEHDICQKGTKIYFEQALKASVPVLSSAFSLLKEKKSGQVCYRLYQYT